jgi:hypothetical protein
MGEEKHRGRDHVGRESGCGIPVQTVLFERSRDRRSRMEWTTPSFEEVSLNCEVSSYANAEL